MIASIAIAAGLPLYTTNPDDFAGLDDLLSIVPVTCPGCTVSAGGRDAAGRGGKTGESRRDKNVAKNQLPRWPATS
jgi:hypothetical protein